MGMRKPFSDRINDIDPAVADLLRGMGEQQENRSLPKKVRERKAKAASKLKLRNRVMVDMPPEVEGLIGALAAEHGVPASGIISLACWLLIKGVDEGEINLNDYKIPSRSPRFDSKITLPKK